jgi:hypothetical protein
VETDKEVIELLSALIKLLFAPVMLPIAILNLMAKIVGLLFAPIILFVGVMLKLIGGIMRLIVVPIAVTLIVSFVVSLMRMFIKFYHHDKNHMKKMECLFGGLSRKKHKPKKEAVRVDIKDAEETKAEETKAVETKEEPAVKKVPETMKERGSTKGGSTGAGV